jgi:predicted house-cleaning noncanonical NTP pyrophosphatase (MazG superfamily)
MGVSLVNWSRDRGWRIIIEDSAPVGCGAKAQGLGQLPSAWGIPWVVVPISACSVAEATSQWAEVAANLLDHFRQANINIDGRLIVRSSGLNENMDMRGQLDSLECTDRPDDLARTMRDVAYQVPGGCPVVRDAITCATIVQPLVRPDYRGHLSNEYRHAQRSVDFLYEVESLAGGSTALPKRFRLRRPVRPPKREAVLNSLLVNDNESSIEDQLRTVGAWLAAQNLRGHLEWLIAQKQMKLVQLDLDPVPPRVDPMSERPIPIPGPPLDVSELGSAFVSIGCGCDFSGLRKTRSHALLKDAGAFVPEIFVARNVGDSILDRNGVFWRELTCLLRTPAIIRFDVALEKTEWTNLPTVWPVSSFDEVWQKVQDAVDTVRTRGLDLAELSVVVHHFIAARAAAWSEASPASQDVRIDSIWGLPDGLQSFVHDSTVYTVDTGKISPQIRYKDRFIDVNPSGECIVRRASPSIARDEVCKIQDVRLIGEISMKVARATGKTVRIMWFLDVIAGAGRQPPSAMPWIVQELDRDAGIFQLGRESDRDNAGLRLQAELHAERAVRNRATLEKFRRNPAAMDIGARHVLLQPDASVVRDRDFLGEFATVVKALPNQWKVLYAGSMLAHAPYQLRELKLPLLPLHQEVRPPRRTYMRKLVRDGIPDRISAGGERADVLALDDREYLLALRQKMVEEALEVAYSADSDELREELADLLTVARALAVSGGVDSWAEVERAAKEKEHRRGGFSARLFLRATGFYERAEQVVPGGAVVERLRDGNGFRVPLIPPLTPLGNDFTLEFKRLNLDVAIEFREHHVHVRLLHSNERLERENLQLRLFDDDD